MDYLGKVWSYWNSKMIICQMSRKTVLNACNVNIVSSYILSLKDHIFLDLALDFDIFWINLKFSQYESFSRRLKYVLPCTKFNVFGLFWPEAPFYRMNWGVTLKILLSELSFIYDKKDERNLHSLKSLIMATIFCPPCSLRWMMKCV